MRFQTINRAILCAAVVGFVAMAGGIALASPSEPFAAQSGTLFLKSSPDSLPVEALRAATSIQAQVTGNVARVRVTQLFSNDGDDWVEGLYVFPLSADAAVDELSMTIGARTVRGDIQEKAQAQATYAQARSEGKQASIVDQERPNMFTTAVANIAPHSAVSIEIAYLETIPYKDSRYTLRLPLAITPRYAPNAALDPSQPMAAGNAAVVNLLTGATATPERVTAARQKVDIQVELATGFPLASVASLHHPVESRDDAAGKQIHLLGTQVAADHDFELVWAPAAGAEVATAAFAEKLGDDTFALLLLTPPNNADESTQSREVTFIIDTSGSMQGPSIEQASAALQMGVDRLKAGDRFNIIRFASDFSSLFATPQSLDGTSRILASHFIAGLVASGGTEMRAPLERAMSTPPTAGYLQQIVFITDGSVSNEAELIGLIRERAGATRLFTVGIGAAPNSYFLQQAAAAGRGSYTFIAERAQVGARMQDLFQKLERPALVDLKLLWPNGLAPDLASSLPADVYAGDPVVILARLPHAPSGALTLSGTVHGASWVHAIPITPVSEQAGLSKLWARERIADMSRQIQFGGDKEHLRTAIVDLALAHHLVSEFTSLVAVDDEVVRPPGSTGRVEQPPTSAPVGSYWATTGFARTATPSDLLLLCGLLSMAMGTFVYWRSSGRAAARP
jgi:Ca-activated chloride channel homolog